jgi:serine/threonine-protein kinase
VESPLETRTTVADRPEEPATTVSPLEALRQDELARTRRVVVVIYLLAGATLAVLPWLGGGDFRRVVVVGLVAGIAAATWLWYLASAPERYRPGPVALVWFVCAAGVCAGVAYFGVFSPAPMVLVLGIYFIGLGQSRWVAAAIYAMSALFYLAAAGAIVAGWIEDPGVLVPTGISTTVRILVIALVETVLVAAAFLGRTSRQATLDAITHLEHAVRRSLQREALLQEAQHDLERALRAGGAGRLTDRTLGSFRLGDVLGRGAMGEVYEAVHVATGHPAAVKVLGPSLREDPHYRERFRREIAAAAALRSPHVVRVIEFGDDSDEVPYLAMERLRGRDLAQHLREHRRLPPPEVVALVTQVARGVDAAADAGIVHRDLKPQNLFLAEEPGGAAWKILDFGVSKLVDGETLTQGQAVGTPSYMAPEQAAGKPVDRRTDVYALGAIAYRALTGQPPFGGRDVPAILYSVVHETPPAPSDLADVSGAVDAVLAVAMAKDPALRFAAAADLAAALTAAVAGSLDDATATRARAALGAHPWSRLR